MSKEKEVSGIVPRSSVDMALSSDKSKNPLFRGVPPDKTAALSTLVQCGLNDIEEASSKPSCKPDDLPAIQKRTGAYLQKCVERGDLPTVEGWAVSLGIGRKTLYRWLSDTRYKEVYDFLSLTREEFSGIHATAANKGLTNPVAWIFTAKNHYEYSDKTEVSIAPANPLGNQTDPEELKRKYIEATSEDYPTLDADKYTQKSENE